MSWSVNTDGPVTAETLAASLRDSWQKVCDPDYKGPPYIGSVSPDQQEAAKDAFEAGILAAKALIESGCVGAGKTYQVFMSGHANPGHEPKARWGNDSVSIGISQS